MIFGVANRAILDNYGHFEISNRANDIASAHLLSESFQMFFLNLDNPAISCRV